MTFDGVGAQPLLRILLIEDDEDDYVIARDVLAGIPDACYELDWERTFDSGVRAFRFGRYDACLLDYRLGAANGIDFLREADADRSNTPVIVLTGRGNEEIDRRLMMAGSSDFIEKAHLSARALERSIRYCIEHKRISCGQRLLAEAGRALAISTEIGNRLGVAVRVPVPYLADWTMISHDCGGAVGASAEGFHAEEAGDEGVRRLVRIPHFLRESQIACGVREDGAPRTLDLHTADALGESSAQEEVREVLAELDTRYLAMVPLSIRGRILGLLVCGRSSGRRPFDSRDLFLAQEYAERVAMALENARLYEVERDAVRARDELLSMVSHDLGNPLSAVVMGVERLFETHDFTDSPRLRDHLAIIRSSAETMTRLVQDLLDVSRAEAGHLTMERRGESIGPLVLRAVRPLREIAEEAGVEIELEALPEELIVEVDSLRIVQVLSNLLSNAIKFTPSGGRVLVRVTVDDAEATITVADSGIGIERDHLPHLFDRFWQARKSRRGGAGLGLTIAREIVTGHGGKIWAESVVGRGSSFHFTLPLVRS